MPKLSDYECESCGNVQEMLFGDTEEQPDYHEDVCNKCGGKMKRGLNLKNNVQCWRVNYTE
jgi:predicted nucleic acid-binding Zn ribbon protein